MLPSRTLRTSSFRLTLLYAGLFTASVLILFGIIYWSAMDYAAQDETNEIGVEFAAIQDEARLAGDARLPEIIANHLRQRAGEGAAYLLEDSSESKVAGNIPEMPPREGAMMLNIQLDGKRHEVRAIGYRLTSGNYLLIGQDTYSLREMKELIARAFGVSIAVTLLLAVLGGIVISNSALRRVEAVSKTSRAIVAGDLTQRVPLRGTNDEFDHLAGSVNAMLDRIEDLMRSMRQVSNDIAHDLRTPLTRLRQRLEHAQDPARSVVELRETLDGASKQIDSILDTFGALLRIAQIEAGGQATALGVVDVSALLTRIADDFAPAAEDRGQQLLADVSPGLTLPGDRELLTQMVVNLVDNAIRHSPPRSRIHVEARLVRDAVELTVADTGTGVPPAERENVLRPFYRLESSRTTEGSGLGLSLVVAIVKRHRATLRLTDNDPGLRVSVLFPAYGAVPG